MKYMLRLSVAAAALVTFAILLSCSGISGDEGAGDKAYNLAQKSSGTMLRDQQKTAYMHYRRAVKADTANVSPRLRNRFLDMCLVRALMVLDEGGARHSAIPLLMEDIEELLNNDVEYDTRQRYAAFLVQLGDSSAARDRFIDALAYYDRAIDRAADAAPFKEKRSSVITKVAEENYQIGRMEFEAGVREKDPDKFVRAEYFAKVALYFDSTFNQAQKLLSDAYKANTSTYAAFLKVIDDYTDTIMFRRINKYDILLAVPAIKGGQAIISIYGNSFNPLRMRSEHFILEDVNGKRYPAIAGQKMAPDMLDQEREAEYTLRFPPTGSASIKKLIYENGPHYSEKNFF